MRRTGLPRRAVVLVLLGLVVASATAATTATLLRPPAPPAAAPPTHDVLATLPISFEATDGGFVSRGPGYRFALTPAGAVVGVGDGSFGLRPAGPLANPAAELEPARPLPGTVTRISGADPSRWRSGAPTYARVSARQVWPGIDMVWHGDEGRLQHDMVVAPGADPALVTFDLDGARSLSVDAAGDLTIDLGPTTARLARPVLYQEVAGARRPVDGAFAVLGPARIGFTVGTYDPRLPLVIDPTLLTSSLLGGTGIDAGYAIAVDPQGNTYVAGTTESADFPTQAPLQTALSGAAGVPSADAFVTKISPDGSRMIWSTFLGGAGRDIGYAVAVAGDGSVYVSGVTESPDFPTARGAQTAYGGGTSDGFVARIAANGTGIEWSSFIGGGGADRARGLAVDTTGNAYLTGSTNSDNFPSVNPQQPGPFRPDDLDAFVAKFPPNGAPLTYSTRLGGGSDDRGLAIAVDVQGNAYVTGDTVSPGFPTVRPLQASFGGSAAGAAGAFTDAFVAKYNPTGSALVYSTFLGGSDFDQGTAIAVDAQGAAYVAGNTNSPNFPTVAALQATKGNDPDGFVTKIDAQGSAVVYSTYLGGAGADGANAIVVDRTGSAHVAGTTGSANFVVARATQGAKSGGDDAFVVKLDSTGRGPLFSTFLGGRETDAGMGVAVTAQGVVRVLGLTASADFPSVAPVAGAKPASGGDAFVAAIELVDPVAPTTVAPEAEAAPAAPSSAAEAHDRRVRIYGVTFLVLLLAAVAQTAYLRRRAPSPAPAGRRPGGGAPPRPAATPAPAPASASGAGGGPAPAKSTRAPKARGGPKTASAQKKAAQAKKAAERRAANERAVVAGGGSGAPDGAATAAVGAAGGAGSGIGPPAPAAGGVGTDDVAGEPTGVGMRPAPAGGGVDDSAGDGLGDGGPPTVATPAIEPQVDPPRRKPQAPAIAALLEEDFWTPDPTGEGDELGAADRAAAPTGSTRAADDAGGAAPAGTEAAPAGAAGEEAAAPAGAGAGAGPEWAPFDTGSVPVVGGAPAGPAEGPAVPIPPVPPEELSFWDLFPEDLPPARPVPFPADDVLVDPLALPDTAAPAGDGRPGAASGAEIVIAELLDGPLPAGTRLSAQSQWAPGREEDFYVADLLADRSPAAGSAPPPAPAPGDDAGGPTGVIGEPGGAAGGAGNGGVATDGPAGAGDRGAGNGGDATGAPGGAAGDSPPGAGEANLEPAVRHQGPEGPPPGRRSDDQARIAADQARRRRSRRGRRPGSG